MMMIFYNDLVSVSSFESQVENENGGRKSFYWVTTRFYFQLKSNLSDWNKKLQLSEFSALSHHLQLVIDVKNTVAVIVAVFVILHTVAIIVLITIEVAITILILVLNAVAIIVGIFHIKEAVVVVISVLGVLHTVPIRISITPKGGGRR